MNKPSDYRQQLLLAAEELRSEEKAQSSRRYFPPGFRCLGVTAADIKTIVAGFHTKHGELSANDVLAISEYMLKHAHYNEETLIAFAILNKYVKKHFDDHLLQRFEYWLEHYTDNWAQVDDLCIKTIYHFLLARPHLIEQTRHWVYSEVSWCRRASNVVWVKFIKRKIGKQNYCLKPELIFNNCNLLLEDSDSFVQKSVGWLLKVTAVHHEHYVVDFLQSNIQRINRSTLRYAIEKLEQPVRNRLLALPV